MKTLFLKKKKFNPTSRRVWPGCWTPPSTNLIKTYTQDLQQNLAYEKFKSENVNSVDIRGRGGSFEEDCVVSTSQIQILPQQYSINSTFLEHFYEN